MTSSTVWDLMDSAVIIMSRLPMIIQMAAVLIAAEAVISNAGKILILKGALSAMLGRGMGAGLNPFG